MNSSNQSYIPLNRCEHGYLYRIRSRNLLYGVYNKNTEGFIGIRMKFGDLYLFTEHHYDTGAPFGTVKPKEQICKCPIEDLIESNKFLFDWLNQY